MGKEVCSAVERVVRNFAGLQLLWLDGNEADANTKALARKELAWVGELRI